MINKVSKVLANSGLLAVLLLMLILPLGTMAISSYTEETDVLGEADYKPEEENLPEEIEEIIRKLEQEFYESSESTPVEETRISPTL